MMLRKNCFAAILLVVLAANMVVAPRLVAQSVLEVRLRPLTPRALIDAANAHPDAGGDPLEISIIATRADLEGTGKFDFVVASYTAGIYLGDLVVLRETNNGLQAISHLGPSGSLAGEVELSPVDIDGDGRVEIVYRSFGINAHFSLDLLQWTGNALRSLTPMGIDTEDAELFDVDNDGVLEIVTPGGSVDSGDPSKPEPITTPFKVYKFNGTQFALASTSSTDPTGRVNAAGANQSVFPVARVKPNHFSLEQIREAREKHESSEGEVTVRLGNLTAPVDDNPGPRSVNDLDLKSLILGRNIWPLRTRIVPAEDEPENEGKPASADDDSKERKPVKLQGPFVEAKFSRQAVLEFLPRTQLTKPLEPGDKLTLEIRGKMKNRAPVFSSVQVTIVGEHESDPQKRPKEGVSH